MTRKEENQQSSKFKFKIKLIKIKDPIPRRNMGIYGQMENGNRIQYNRGEFNAEMLRQVFDEIYKNK